MTGTTSKNKGFTLIEVLVAITIFSGILILLLSIVTHTTFIQKQQSGTQATQEEMRFALDLFNREARTGYGDTFVGTSTPLYAIIDFRNQAGNCVEYRYDKTKKSLDRAEDRTDPDKACDTESVYTDYTPLVSPKIIIENLLFTVHKSQVDQTSKTLTNQGFVQISIEAAAQASPDTVLHFQTGVTSRQTTPWI